MSASTSACTYSATMPLSPYLLRRWLKMYCSSVSRALPSFAHTASYATLPSYTSSMKSLSCFSVRILLFTFVTGCCSSLGVRLGSSLHCALCLSPLACGRRSTSGSVATVEYRSSLACLSFVNLRSSFGDAFGSGFGDLLFMSGFAVLVCVTAELSSSAFSFLTRSADALLSASAVRTRSLSVSFSLLSSCITASRSLRSTSVGFLYV